jgi:hypothetical protein
MEHHGSASTAWWFLRMALDTWPMRLTTKVASAAKMKPGTISYRPSQPPCFQTTTVTAPTMMPASAPLRVMAGQNSDRMMTGPKAAPKPAQA